MAKTTADRLKKIMAKIQKRYMTDDGSINIQYGIDNYKKIEKKGTNSSTISGNSRKEDKEINVNHDAIVNTLPNEDDNNNKNTKSYANQVVNTNSLNIDINDSNTNDKKNNKDKNNEQAVCIIF